MFGGSGGASTEVPYSVSETIHFGPRASSFRHLIGGNIAMLMYVIVITLSADAVVAFAECSTSTALFIGQG